MMKRRKKKGGAKGDSDWEAHQDEDGDTYYANAKTGETSWTDPRGGRPVSLKKNPMARIELAEVGRQASASMGASAWEQHETEDGTPYWHNTDTDETTWEQP
jgi:pre-mRNA-processing factor 40